MARPSPQNPDAFEDHVKNLLENNYDYEVIKPSKNQRGYDLEIIGQGGTSLSEDGESGGKPPDRPKVVFSPSEDDPSESRKSIAVQCKNLGKRCGVVQLKVFISFMGAFQGQIQFSEGWLISSNGFTPKAIEHARKSGENTREPVVSLYTANEYDIREDYRHPRSSMSLLRDSPLISTLADHQSNTHKKVLRRYYFGIFTNKGGTGKTTVAAHLAGAFALMGYDIILLDIDPQRNLKKLFQNDDDENSALYVPPLRPGQMGCGIYILDNEEWEADKSQYDDISIVICDCNPTLEENPGDLVKEFDYCIVPTTLNPIGIAKNSDVIQRTFEKIRAENSTAKMHVLINCYDESNKKSTQKRNSLLLKLLKEQIDFDEDKGFYLIDPNICAIHRSDSLYYWGMHIVENKEPQLAFELYGGRCVPGDDFLKLAECFHGKFEES